jgi:hypothetical protein
MTRAKMRTSLLGLMLLAACGAPDEPNPIADYPPDGKADSSHEDTILDFAWDGTIEYPSDGYSDAEDLIRSQLYYTIGQLNGSNAVGRMDRAKFTGLQSSKLSNGRTQVTFHGTMPVAWGSKTNLPTSYTFRLPRLIDGFSAFVERYKATCAESTDEPVDTSSMWYYYRPDQSGCSLTSDDIVTSKATVTVSAINTTGKYPEYDKVWEDGALRVVSIFGKFEKGDTTASDVGISAYNEFVGRVRARLSAYSPTVTPADVSDAPGVAQPEVAFQATLPDGKQIFINALLVDEVSSLSSDDPFYARYNDLSTSADFIAYNGHAGLGANIRTLATKGNFVPCQYVIVFMNGCDTYTYVDTSLANTRAQLNPDDPSGTKYMDFILNAMPAYFANDASSSMAVVEGLLSYDHPRTYEQILTDIDSSQLVLVSGEQDNKFTPGTPIVPADGFASGPVCAN